MNIEKSCKTKNTIVNVAAIGIGYGSYKIVDELIRKNLRKLYFNKGLIAKYSITCVEAFIGIKAWEFGRESLLKLL